jgi:hypothetical protein
VLPDPIPTITINSVTYDLARTGVTGKTGNSTGAAIYQTSNGLDRLTIEHSVKNRKRDVVRFDRTKVAATPFDAAKDQEYSMSAYVVVDSPRLGFTSAEKDYVFQLLSAFWVAGSPDYGLRVLNGEI